MKKRAQTILGLSFSMIFSIILIIAVVAVAIYVIAGFMNTNKCTEIGFFFDDLNKEVDKAWKSEIYHGLFDKIKVPSDIELICFGNLTLDSLNHADIRDELKEECSESSTLFLYPPENACDASMAEYSLKHIKTFGNKFFCIEPEKGVRLDKESSDSLVTLKAQ